MARRKVWVVVTYLLDESGMDGIGLTVFDTEKKANKFATWAEENLPQTEVEVWPRDIEASPEAAIAEEAAFDDEEE